MKIGDFDLEKDILLVAEIGNNHEGKFDLAVKLVEKAAEAGVDAVKFQAVRASSLVPRSNQERYKRLKTFEFSEAEFAKLAEIAATQKLMFLCTPFDLETAEFLNRMVPAFKIASGDLTYKQLLEKVADFDKPVVLSCGNSEMADVAKAVDILEEKWGYAKLKGRLALMHCVVSYPTPADQANLRTIEFLRNKFKLIVGYSDHTEGTDAAVVAAALGARIIEKHFTIDKNYSDFRDHKLSADPAEMKQLSDRLKQLGAMLGEYAKPIMPCEKETGVTARRSLCLNHAMKKGEVLKESDFVFLRPGTGISPMDIAKAVGRKLKADMPEDAVVTADSIEPR